MTDISVSKTNYQVEKLSWLLDRGGWEMDNITLDVSAFVAATHYPNGYIPSGTNLGKITATSLYGPTITQATATSAIATGAVSSVTVVTGGSGYLVAPAVSFTGGGGTGATATATINASGVVTGVTVTAGGSGYTSAPTVVFTADGRETHVGHLGISTKVPNAADTTKDVGAPLLFAGVVKESKLPAIPSAAAKTAVAGWIRYV